MGVKCWCSKSVKFKKRSYVSALHPFWYKEELFYVLFIKKYISTQVKHTILHLKSELFKSQVMIQVVAISAYATCKCFPRLCSYYSNQ